MLPQDALDWLRSVFDKVDRQVSFRLSAIPFSHEPALDQLFISALQGVQPFVVTPSNTTVWIDTHFLGGRQMFYNWEVADIGMLFVFRVRGEYRFTKVVLLQSKRLYPDEVEVQDDLRRAFEVGFARLFPPDDVFAMAANPRAFTFSEDSKYLALPADDNQISVIRQYQSQRGIPVQYLFYNPHDIPWSVVIPATGSSLVSGPVSVGTRIVPSEIVFDVCEQLGSSESPSIAAIKEKLAERSTPDGYGWRLSEYIVDHVLHCREGRIIQPNDSGDLHQLFSARSGPISAAIAVMIDVADDESLPGEAQRELPE